MPQVIGVGKMDECSQVQENSGVKKIQLDLLQLFLIKEAPSGLKLVGIPEFCTGVPNPVIIFALLKGRIILVTTGCRVFWGLTPELHWKPLKPSFFSGNMNFAVFK